MPYEMEPGGRFGTLVYEAMKKQGLTVNDLAEKLDATYEYLRKMMKGESYPSKLMLKSIAREMRLNQSDLERAVTADRMETKYGKMAHEILGQPPEVAPFNPIIPTLKAEQREALLSMARTFQKQNRAEK